VDIEDVEYRADHIEIEELEKITAETDFYRTVLNKLMSRGSKVIVGPRGVGKTHHMRIAYKKCIANLSKPLPIYVSYSKYLRLEPLKNTSAIAIQFFHCWILCKIILGIKESLSNLEHKKPTGKINESEISWDEVKLFCEQIEKQQQLEWHESLLKTISVSFVSELIESLLLITKRKHSIILCDDAALVLTQDYMIEFMDVFRSLKSSKISPKASVYPNTEFGPRFHMGHDAESVPCWPSITDEDYETLFNDIYHKRFNGEIKEDIKKCFMYACFGAPRAFINLINEFNRSSGTDQQRVNLVIEGQAKLIEDEYMSLAKKQPQFKNFVIAGRSILNHAIKELSEENKKSLSHNKTQIVLGIKQNETIEKTKKKNINIIIRLLEETGLLQKTTQVKHGKDRVYDRYIPHFTLLLSNGAFQIGRGSYIGKFTEYIGYTREKHPLRKNSFADFDVSGLLFDVSLDLPNCAACEKPRSNEEQKFCMHCGVELINKSTFEMLVNSKIETLPITDWQKKKIKEETEIETIGDVVLSTNPGQELMKAHGIGKHKASHVIKNAQEWMDEYLS
jgi:hypothetical protein